jgi:imidazolonepropionase-like amidohydrolase
VWSPIQILRRLVRFAVLSALTGTKVWSQLTPNADLALIGGTIYTSPAEEPIRNGVVLIQGGNISAVGSRTRLRIPKDTPQVECWGLTITAGFWNSHMHFFERKWENAAAIPASEISRQLQEMLTRYGFTSVFDIGSMRENTHRIRDRIEAGEVAGPGIRSTGEALIAPGAMPPDTVIRMLGNMTSRSPEITNATEAAVAARKLLDAGVDGIKVHLQRPSPPHLPIPESAMHAAVEQAHRAGKPVFVHPNDRTEILAAVRAGADILAHTTPRSPWDETVLRAMKERRVALTPTLTVWKYLLRHDRISVQEEAVHASIDQLRTWVAYGGDVLFGNDLGAVEYNSTEEYRLMTAAGMNFRQILASLTTAPAERFGESSRLGQIAAGFQADLVVFEGDPSADIEALAAVRYTLRAGKIIYRASRPRMSRGAAD